MGTSGVIELLQALRTFHDSFIHNTIMMMYTDAISADIIVSVGRYFNLQALQGDGGEVLIGALLEVRHLLCGGVERTNKSLVTHRISLAASRALRTRQTPISLLSLLTGGSDEADKTGVTLKEKRNLHYIILKAIYIILKAHSHQ